MIVTLENGMQQFLGVEHFGFCCKCGNMVQVGDYRARVAAYTYRCKECIEFAQGMTLNVVPAIRKEWWLL